MKNILVQVAFCNSKNMETFSTRLHDGQDLLREIQNIVKENNIQAGVI